ncbi:hypothetical protein PYW07_008271 [Mythimna separata]|uniref:Peptidase S1 domain-containing protein n=1 Tax=Mythimna separata TaxID=271217 RepID=A0AAD7YCD0_MYTSE|nr:hypothetical protein PYW07_008271 [Mythimna separata]
MFKKSGLFILVLTVFQVSARYQSVEQHLIDNEIHPEQAELSSSSSRIVSGWEALPGQHPHHAALELMHTFGWVLCGGSIISKEWIVTAAPCAFGRVLAIVRVGSVSLVDKNPENIFETTEWYTHPKYNGLSGVALQSHGVTLVKLQRPLVYSSDTTIELRWVYLRALSNTACRNAYTSGVFDTTICARYFNVTSQSTCNDDLGGPLVHVDSDGIPTLIGISYFFPGGTCESGQPSGFYRPGVFLPWFQEVTGIDFENLQEDDDNYSTEDDTTTANNPTTTTTTASTSTTISTTTTTLTTLTTMTTPGITTTSTTPITTTTPTASTSPSTITTPITTTIYTTTASEDQDLEELTTEDNTTLPPEDTEEKEEDEIPDSPQVLKYRKVNVNVKVQTNIKQM